jgi:hypothetical protein
MRMPFAFWVLACLPALAAVRAQEPLSPTAELDAFMQRVLTRRDDNWKRIQQYILDERERVEVRGPGEVLLWGADREYMWYPRDGFLVRSPVRFNGVGISAGDRETYEQNFLRRARNRDRRAREREAEKAGAPVEPEPTPGELQGLIQQTREPQFVSSAYLLQFKFEGGRYAFVGPEMIENRKVLRIEYYPTRLFSEEPSTRAEARANQAAGGKSKGQEYGEEMRRLMNKVSMVTIWVEPNQKQIVKYTFDNTGLEFLPASWLVRVTDFRANMSMTEAFPDVWLPKRVDVAGAFILAPGPFSVTYDIQYSGYREAAATGKYLGPSGR